MKNIYTFDYFNFPFRFEVDVKKEIGFLLEYIENSYVNDEHNVSWPTSLNSLIHHPMVYNTTHGKVNILAVEEITKDDTAYRL